MCKSTADRKREAEAMTHEERLKAAANFRNAGIGMLVGGLCTFGGMLGGLWPSMGSGALGAAFGAASGLVFGSMGPFRGSKMMLAWDEEFMSMSGAAVGA